MALEITTNTNMKTKIRTNSKQVTLAIRNHIQECVTDDDGETFPTVSQAINHLRSEFERVSNYPQNLLRFPNNQDRFHGYLMGIPFSFEFMDYRISEFLNGLGINPDGKEFSSDKSARLYTYLLFKQL